MDVREVRFRGRLPLGAELAGDVTAFRYWAPDLQKLTVVPEDGDAIALEKRGDGWFVGEARGPRHGWRYRLRLDDRDVLPDPYSRCQPEGPLGPSMLVDPAR